MQRVSEERYIQFIKHYANKLFCDVVNGNIRSSTKGQMAITQHKNNRGVTVAQKIQFPKATIYHLRTA